MLLGAGSMDNETRNEIATGYNGSEHLDNNVFHQEGRDTLKRTFLPGHSMGESVAAANIARENGDYGTAVKEGAKAIFDGATLGKAGMTGGASGIVKTTTTPTGIADSEIGHTVIEQAGDMAFGKNDNNNTQSQQDTDKPTIGEHLWDYGQQVTQTGKYNPDNYKTEPQARYDYDLQKQYDRELQKIKENGDSQVEKGNLDRYYDQQQAERNAYKPSDDAVENYRQRMIDLNNLYRNDSENLQKAHADLFGQFRDGKLEPTYSDDNHSSQNTPNADNQKYDDNQSVKDNPSQDNQKSDDGNKLKMDTPNLDNQPKDTPQTDNDSKSAWEKFVENFIEKPLEWLGWKDKDTPESQLTELNGQGETDPTGSGNGDNDNPNNPNGNPEPLQVPGAGNGFGAGLGDGNGAGTKDLGDPKTPFYDPLLIALQTGGNNTSISVVSHNEKYNACNDEYFFQAA